MCLKMGRTGPICYTTLVTYTFKPVGAWKILSGFGGLNDSTSVEVSALG